MSTERHLGGELTRIVDGSHSAGLSLSRESRRAHGVLSTVEIDGDVPFRWAFNASEAHTHSAVRIAPAEATAVAPRRVEMSIRFPRNRPQITTRRRRLEGFRMPRDIADHRAWWVRRLIGNNRHRYSSNAKQDEETGNKVDPLGILAGKALAVG